MSEQPTYIVEKYEYLEANIPILEARRLSQDVGGKRGEDK